MTRWVAFGAVVLAAAAVYGADPRFRADDGSLWRLSDNPASWGAMPDVFSFGYAQNLQGDQDAVLVSPLVSLRVTKTGDVVGTEFGAGLKLDPSFLLGYRSTSTTASTAVGSDFGLLWRPWNLLSLALTVDDGFGSSPVYGAGVAVRPLAAWKGLGSLLTLSADATLTSKGVPVPQTLGARLSLDGLGLRAWYDWQQKTTGAELTLNLGPSESSVVMPTLSSADDIALAKFGTALRFGYQGENGPSLGDKILRIKDLASLDDAPKVNGAWASLLGAHRGVTVADLLAVLRRAVTDASVVAVAFENPPVLAGLSDAQDLAAVFDQLKKAGKKFYLYADSFSSSSAFQALWSRADRVVLNANGSLDLQPLQSERLYYKDFLDKIGVKFLNLAPWDTKSYNNDLTFSSMPEGERAMNLRLLGEIQSQLTDALSQGREGRLKGRARELADKGPYGIPTRALDAGLVDALDYRASFEDSLLNDHPGAVFVDDLPVTSAQEWGSSPFAKKVALVSLNGDIVLGPGTPGVSIGSDTADEIARLREDPSVAALLLRVNSPGGVVITSDVIAEEVRKTVASGKPVVVSMGNYGASGGYYVSALASRIFAQPGTITGSIGVTAALPSVAGALDKLGIHPDAAALSPNAGFADPLRDFRPADVRALGDEIASVYDRFVAVVAKGRGLAPEVVKLAGEGQVWSGREALSKGLIDELGTLDDAKTWLEGKLGAPIDLQEVYPGQSDALTGLDSVLPAGSTLKRIQTIAGPALAAWERVAELGSGPLVFYEGALQP